LPEKEEVMKKLTELDYEELNKKGREYFLGRRELVELGRKDVEYNSGSGMEDLIGQDRAMKTVFHNEDFPDDTKYYAIASTADISSGFPRGLMHVIFFKLKKPPVGKKGKSLKKRKVSK